MGLVVKIRDGSLLDDFLVDRAALGLSADELAGLVVEQLDVPVSVSDVSRFLVENEARIEERRQQLKDELVRSSPSVLRRVEEMNEQVLKRFNEADKLDVGDFSKIVQQYRQNLELVAKLLGELRDSSESVFRASDALSSLAGLEFLESKGLISIKNRNGLEVLLS